MRARGYAQSVDGAIVFSIDSLRRVVIHINSGEVELQGAWQEPCVSVWRIRPRHWQLTINDAALGRVQVTIAPVGRAESEAARLFGREASGDYMYGIDCVGGLR